ncbi:MAG TPA: HNH endonuclease [Rhizobiaceae bacterium]|nr:HNH endonuclease [Rhizobiaceae bacterium]
MANRPKLYRPPHQRTRQEQKRDADRKRGSARDRGYTVGWDRASLAFKYEHPLCLGCEAVGRYTATQVVDHTVPHKGDAVLFWDRDNWQPSCQWHHDVVKQILERMFARGKIGEAELKLNSSTAMRLTLQYAVEPGGGSKV